MTSSVFLCDCFLLFTWSLFIYLFVYFYIFVCFFCYHQGQGTAEIGEGGENSWIVLDDDDDDDDQEMKDDDEIEITGEKNTPETIKQSPQEKNGSKGEKKQHPKLYKAS